MDQEDRQIDRQMDIQIGVNRKLARKKDGYINRYRQMFKEEATVIV